MANHDEVLRLVRRADEVRKAEAARRDPALGRAQAEELLAEARELLDELPDGPHRDELTLQVTRRIGDIDREELETMLVPTPGVARAPTRMADPSRVPPGQRLTPGWPVLHVGRAPEVDDPAAWTVTVTGRVSERVVLRLADLQALPTATRTTDFHCVTRWSRLDNTWTGVRVAEVLRLARPRPEATHAVVAGHPAYTANLDLPALLGDDVLLAWDHDGAPLDRAHGGPLRLVVPARYGWKSVKWVTEIRLTDRDVPGYWEERGYHDVADPWREQRFHDD
jgi:DMSO/TMAO reductase YedYZ molybdopterin-dependent catalytic subunit